MAKHGLALTRSHVGALVAVAVASAFFASCGGSGNGGDPTPLTVLAPIVPMESGAVNQNDQALLNSSMCPGDSAADLGVRGFGAFDITVVPAGATIVSATLWVKQTGTLADPYVTLGSVAVDHVTGLSYSDLKLGPTIGVVSSEAAPGLRSIDVTTQLEEDLSALRTRSYFRLQFAIASDLDGQADIAYFMHNSPECHLEIRYLP